MLFLPTRACMMTLTVTVQSWTIQAVRSPANRQPTGEKLTPQPPQTPADLACECLVYSMRPLNTQRHDQGHCREAGNREQEDKTNPW